MKNKITKLIQEAKQYEQDYKIKITGVGVVDLKGNKSSHKSLTTPHGNL